MSLLAVKLLLAPSFVVGASLAARRYGPRLGGLLAGLPVVAGPILLIYALAHGRQFAATAAAGTLLGLISLIAFAVLYGRLASRVHWPISLVLGWLGFIACTAVFSTLSISAAMALALVGLALALGLVLLPAPPTESLPAGGSPAWDLPLRAGCATALVLTLTAISGWLGPQLAGLLAPFPIVATVLSTFTHAQRGHEDTVRLLRAMISGFGAFALFCFTIAVTVRELTTAQAFALASTAAIAIQLPSVLRVTANDRAAVDCVQSQEL